MAPPVRTHSPSRSRSHQRPRTPLLALRARGLRAGLTLIEILWVMMIFAVVVTFAAPRLGALRGQSSVKAARQKVAGLATTARSTARRDKRVAALYVNGDSAWTRVRNASGGLTKAGPTLKLVQELKVTTTFAAGTQLDSILYDLRGVGRTYLKVGGTARVGESVKLHFTSEGKKDSLCINGLGLVGACGI